jgi:hypothetical protein
MAALQKTTHHVRAHAAKSDHSQLHVSALLEEIDELPIVTSDTVHRLLAGCLASAPVESRAVAATDSQS